MSCVRVSAFILLISLLADGHERENFAVSPHQDDCHHSFALSAGWESRYFVEGRDTLNRDSIRVYSAEYLWESLTAGVWYGDSPDQPYDELQLALAWHHNLTEDLEAYISYTHLRFPKDGTHDHDLGLGFAYTGGPWGIEYALDAYYSTRVEGSFAELSASREFELSDKLTSSATLIFGMNQGYVADGHDGANHIAASLGLSYALTESLSLATHATYSWAIDRKVGAADDATLRDFFHAGIGLEWAF